MCSLLSQLFAPTTIDTWLLRNRRPLLALVLASVAFLPTVRGQLPPPSPDGGYPNGNTAEGDGALFSVTSGKNNTAVGFEALFSNTTGLGNTATGYAALFSNIGGSQNTATGVGALYNNHSSSNTADGFNALYSNTTGNANMANGYQALYSNTTGSFNTATGVTALFSNTTAGYNTATGYAALYSNTSGKYNMADGYQALYSNTTGNNNTATGYQALYSNTTSNNTATGYQALVSNTTGSFNTANGFQALVSNTIGGNNIANGVQALVSNTTGSNNTADGLNALYSNTTGSSNIALGVSAGANLTTGSNNIDIFDGGVADEANTIRIGTEGTQSATFIAGISGATVAAGVGVVVDATGHLGTITSSERFKDEIKSMDKASETILALKPVTFHYKHELDPNGMPQFGLVAEQVEKVDPDLVARGDKGQVYAVRYEAVNAMLLNEFLKEHRTVQELKSTVAKQEAIITQQQKRMEAVIARLEKQESQIEKVSASSR
jgi:trimeric autotransporter adhesin